MIRHQNNLEKAEREGPCLLEYRWNMAMTPHDKIKWTRIRPAKKHMNQLTRDVGMSTFEEYLKETPVWEFYEGDYTIKIPNMSYTAMLILLQFYRPLFEENEECVENYLEWLEHSDDPWYRMCVANWVTPQVSTITMDTPGHHWNTDYTPLDGSRRAIEEVYKDAIKHQLSDEQWYGDGVDNYIPMETEEPTTRYINLTMHPELIKRILI